MAVPKRRTSKTRRDKRRANWKLIAPGLVACPQCHEAKLPHHVCPQCGYYKGDKVMTVKEKK
jgi:large subunit ribosomal protein L32